MSDAGVTGRNLLLVTVILAVGSATARSQNFTLTEDQFNSWLGNSGTAPEAAIKGQIATQIRTLKEICRLTPYQVDKLELAGHADLARFSSEVEVLRHELIGKSYNDNEINEVYQKIQPLRRRVQDGVVGPSSLFMKVMHTSLRHSQREQYELVEDQRARQRYQAKLGLFVAALDSAAALSNEQREGLLELVLEETRPPTKFGEYDWYYIMSQASRIPEDRFAGLLDDAQMALLKQCLQQGRQMDRFLTQQQIEPRKEPAVEAKTQADGEAK